MMTKTEKLIKAEESIQELHDKGFSYARIAREMGVCDCTPYLWRSRKRTPSFASIKMLERLVDDSIPK